MAEEVKNQTQVAVNFVNAIISEVAKFQNAISLGKDASKKNIFEEYQNQTKDGARSILSIEQYLEQQAGKQMSEKDVSRLKDSIESLVKHTSNINLALISGYRFVSDANLVSSIAKKFNKNKSEVSIEIFVSVGPLFVGTDRWRLLPHDRVSNENEKNILDEANKKIASIVDKYNELVPNNKISYEVIDNQNMKFNEYIAKCQNAVVIYTRTALTNINESYKKYIFWLGAKYVGITVATISIGAASWYIYENGFEATIDKIKSLIPKPEETANNDNNLFELEEIPVDDNVKEDIALYI